MSTNPQPQAGSMMDTTVDSLIDFSDYDNVAYQSPSLSPATSKAPFPRPAASTASTPTSLLSTSQPLSGPSHQYDLYKQQTGIVPGALASTLAVNQNNSQISGYTGFSIDYMGMGNTDNIFDFNSAPSQNSMAVDTDVDFDSPSSDPSFFFPESTVNPSSIGGQEANTLPSPPVLSSQTSSVGRLWPGMHQQAAMAKAQAQQRQQQQMIQMQQQQRRQSAQPSAQPKPQRPKGTQPTDPIVEQKITQLLNSMRAKPMSDEAGQGNSQVHNHPRLRKDEDDMDDDEKLLASEEGKKLSSKERRQLRNKVSARAFRSRRKEYISQLESEIANKVTENGDLRAQNRALVDENKRLTDLTRMLLSSPSFSDFLDRLSSNPAQVPQTQPTSQQAQPQQQQQQERQLPKDVNPYNAQQLSHQQIGMAMIPEQPMDLSMLSLDSADSFTFQPQVYAVLETPEMPASIDTSMLSGKTSNFVGEVFDSEDDKVEIPVIERPAVVKVEEEKVEKAVAPVVDEEFESDPAFALYHDSTAAAPAESPVELDTEGLSQIDLFSGIEPEKALARYELVDATEEDTTATLAMARVQRISAGMQDVLARLERLTADL